MNVSIKWLSEYLEGEPIKIDKKEIKDYCDLMTYSGSKVESFEILHEELKNIVVGKLLSVEKHPDADKLSVCMADIGESEPVQIVTGAQNVKAGDIVPVAKNNSVVHGGKKIAKGKLRGVESHGMLCSLEELGLSLHDFPYAEEDGILVLRENCQVGQDIKSALLLEDAAIEFEITPNRADCFSYIGIARESAVAMGRNLKLREPETSREDKSDDIKNYLSVEVKDHGLCPRYAAKVIKNAKIEASPMWLRAKLRASGIRPINNIVDITNYVMLEYGQPMHAFDHNYIDGKKIVVRNAEKGEKITTLDSVGRELDQNMLVIADSARPVALAGIMGGENSGILEGTNTIVFESANFEKMCVRRTSRKLGLRTDSSANFEKGLDANLPVAALRRACELVEQLGCGVVVSGIIDEHGALPGEKKISLEAEKINALLGYSIGRGEMAAILERLGFEPAGENAFLVPSSRSGDISGDESVVTADLAEEISRIYGYGNIRSEKDQKDAGYSAKRGGRDEFQKFLQRIHNILTSNGYYETYAFSFVSPKYFEKLNLPENSHLRECITLSNPLGEDTSVMRTTLLASTLATISKNCSLRNERGYFYETAKTYFRPKLEAVGDVKGKFAAEEKNVLSFGFYGEADFYELKGAVENIMESAGIKNCRISSGISGHPLASAFHPGRSALMVSGDGKTAYGIFGEAHPDAAKNFEIGAKCHAAEFDLDLLFENSDAEKRYASVPKYPAVNRDLALVCDEELEASAICEAIEKNGGKIFEWAKAFDVYRGEKIGEGKKSIAFSVSFRDKGRTLEDGEVNAAIDKILKNLEKMNVTLRKL